MTLNVKFSVEDCCGPTLVGAYRELISSPFYIEITAQYRDTVLSEIERVVSSIKGEAKPLDLTWSSFKDCSEEAKGQLISTLHQGFVTILTGEENLSKRAQELLSQAVNRSHEAMNLYLAEEKNALLHDPDTREAAEEAFGITPALGTNKPKMGL